jgi:UDP-2,3-diacylglucosamine pyrophosphatase LpxH
MKEDKRRVEISVISDVHLGTSGCQAEELLNYLKSIKPQTLILNGDIIDIWQFSKRYWPKTHMKIIKQIIGMSTKHTRVYYITGNHDETLRKFEGLQMGNISILNQLVLDIEGKKTWFFHGDVFDVIMQYSKWLAKLGSVGYELLIRLNTFINYLSRLLGKGNVSLSKKIKDNVKTAVKYINDFETSAANLAIRKGYNVIACGHIHLPEIKNITDSKGNSVLYLNSGDWVENLTALEYNDSEWHVYSYLNDPKMLEIEEGENEGFNISIDDLNNKEIFNRMLNEFQN